MTPKTEETASMDPITKRMLRRKYAERMEHLKNQKFVREHGFELKAMRERAGLTQEYVGFLAGVDQSYIAMIEGCYYDRIGGEALRRILDTYEGLKELVDGCAESSIPRLFGGEDDEQRPGSDQPR